jgi:hypothetical protein
MPLLPETEILLGEYGNAAFGLGNAFDCDPMKNELAHRMVKAKEALVEHLETHYTPAPRT